MTFQVVVFSGIATNISIVASNNSRITGIDITTSSGTVQRCNYGDDESLVEYIECLSVLDALIVQSDALHTVIAGDFNCGTGSRFFPLLNNFANENGLVMSDMMRLSNISTYISDDG